MAALRVAPGLGEGEDMWDPVIPRPGLGPNCLARRGPPNTKPISSSYRWGRAIPGGYQHPNKGSGPLSALRLMGRGADKGV